MLPQVLPKEEYGPQFGMRENTSIHRWPINFVFNDEGLGGFVNYTGATTWIAKNCPWVEGKLFAPRAMVPLLSDIHEPYKYWHVYPAERIFELIDDRTAIFGSALNFHGKVQPRQLLTALHAHPFDVGFAYYASTAPPPSDALLPVLDYPESMLPSKVKRLRGQYVVIPAGGTTPTRTLTGKHLNPIIAHVKALGFTPVFLGVRDIFGNGKTVTFSNDIEFGEGVDLRGETSVKVAACIIQYSKCIVGLDGGLLHLAALMKDSRIVFGYNITSVEHRVPRRNHGKTVNVYLKDEELKCAGCQSKWRNLAIHTFDNCMYEDFKCLDLLFENDSARFKAAIDEVLK